MNLLSQIIVGFIAVLHIYILWLEMFAWTTRAKKVFKTIPEDQFEKTKVMAANQGLYNGFLAAGLIWSLLICDATWSKNLALFFLGCVLVAGIYGALTASKRIFFVQAVPAILGILSLVISTNQKKENIDFTFFKWNIRESYYLKLNLSDTLFFINTYPFEESVSYTILNDKDKEILQNVLDTISFPKNETSFENNKIEDGNTYAFELKNNNQKRSLKIHGGKGPIHFWKLGKILETIKARHQFTTINKKFDFSEMNKSLFFIPPPPIIKPEISEFQN
ncbi:DUF1304 domain-containing protein [Flavobacterium macrobrachii]|uniref:DUF1304 domain-containing protein n=1 Tax=Flavobacterium macrobrachii TaxID=591204 RepID=A0ABS2CWQ1_9FLAO|nr:DUF1304 domain-containing protein [Flavobacterium macrobrachii]MBM6499386.1 DUF1304 domain-containing protein [Flavobacterium macrobrachii]